MYVLARQWIKSDPIIRLNVHSVENVPVQESNLRIVHVYTMYIHVYSSCLSFEEYLLFKLITI